MSTPTFMVVLNPNRPNTEFLASVAGLAKHFEAAVTGIAASQPVPLTYGDCYISNDVLLQERDTLERAIKTTESEFHTALRASGLTGVFRSAITMEPVAGYIAQESRAADLIVIGTMSDIAIDVSGGVDTADLTVKAGRPILVVPARGNPTFERVLVGWTDTQPARRAVHDALPYLKASGLVHLVEIVENRESAEAEAHLAEIVLWLERHGITASADTVKRDGHTGVQLSRLAEDKECDVIVAGGYGHAPLLEWLVGGVTRDLLHQTEICLLLSH